MTELLTDDFFMKEALRESRLAAEEDEVPIGAVVVCNGRIIARAHNMVERLKDVTAHAEMLAITAAANYIGGKYFQECTLYVTVEPCPMCAAALRWAQLGKLVYAAADPKLGYTIFSDKLLHPRTQVIKGIGEKEASEMMKMFFRAKR